jgi:hypothetical protein
LNLDERERGWLGGGSWLFFFLAFRVIKSLMGSLFHLYVLVLNPKISFETLEMSFEALELGFEASHNSFRRVLRRVMTRPTTRVVW